MFSKLNSNFYFFGSSLNRTAGINYSLYAQYKYIGLYGGYSSVSNPWIYNQYPINKAKGFHIGLIFKFPEINKNNCFNIYIFYTQESDMEKFLSGGSGVPFTTRNIGTVNYQFITFNPRYRFSFLEGIFSLESGISFNVLNSLEIGLNAAVSLNISELFSKK